MTIASLAKQDQIVYNIISKKMKSFLKIPFATFKSIPISHEFYICVSTYLLFLRANFQDYSNIRLVQGGANPDDYDGSPNTNLTDVNSDEALAADARLENNWLVPVGRTRGTVNIPWSTHSGAHVEAAPNGERASNEAPRPRLSNRSLRSRDGPLSSRRDRLLFSSPPPHLAFILDVPPFVVRTRSLPSPLSLSFSFYLFQLFRSLLFLSLFLSWCEQLSTYLYQENFWPPPASRGYCFPRPGALGIPRLPFSSSVSWYSRQSAFLSLPLCSSSRSRDIVSLSARFDSQEHCIYRCIREKSCTKFQRICFYCMWFRIHEHVNQLYKLMREYVCYSIASLIIRNHESEEI